MGTYSGFASASPPTVSPTDANPYTMGLEFYVTDSPIWLTHLKFFQPSSGGTVSNGIREGAVYRIDTATLVTGIEDFAAPVEGWNFLVLSEPILLIQDLRYKVGIFYPGGGYVFTDDYFTLGDGSADTVNGPLTIPSHANSTAAFGQSTFRQAPTFGYPDVTHDANLWLDVVVTDMDPAAMTSVADRARANMLLELGLSEPQSLSNVDLMYKVLVEDLTQTLVTKTDASIGTHYIRYLDDLRRAA